MPLGNEQHELSLMCRRKLTKLLCSTCDGDIVNIILFRVKNLLMVFALQFVSMFMNHAKTIISRLTL